MSVRTNEKWEALSRDLDEAEHAETLSESRRVAEELRQRANALTATAMDSSAGIERDKQLRSAVSMYRKACASLVEAAPAIGTASSSPSSSPDVQQFRDILLACKLNAGCLMLALGDTKDAWSLCSEVLALDTENPGAARLAAELAARSGRVDEESKWLHHASHWSKARGDKQQLESASCALARLDPKKVSAARSARDLCTQFEKAMAHFKKSDLETARHELLQVWGLAKGALETNSHDQAVRAVAFNTLEGLMEVQGRAGDLQEAERYGREALQLLDERAGGQCFAEEAMPRREGLLLLSLGFLVQATSPDMAREHWRRAATALKTCSDEPLAEAQEALDSLERAIRLCSEHGESSSKGSKSQGIDIAHLEMRAWIALIQLLLASNERDEATKCMHSSVSLMDLLPGDVPVPEAWAELCGEWALLAARLKLADEAERALHCQRDIGRFVGETSIQCEALKSLAVVRQQRKDAAGALEALDAAEALDSSAVEESREAIALLRERVEQAEPHKAPEKTAPEVKKNGSSKEADELREMPFPWELIVIAVLLLGCVIARLLGYRLSELAAYVGLDFSQLGLDFLAEL